jgi:hypothetical protein
LIIFSIWRHRKTLIVVDSFLIKKCRSLSQPGWKKERQSAAGGRFLLLPPLSAQSTEADQAEADEE